MRLLHTADWHLGRTFHGTSLHEDHAAFGDFLVDLAREQRVDGVLVAGDLYDRALPPVDAVRLADDLLGRLAAIAPVVVITGNHDSAPRLAFGAGLLAGAGLHLRTDVARIGEPVMLGTTAVYAIPYLEPDLVRAELGCERGHGPALEAAMARVRADAATRGAGRTVVMAHAFVAGAQETGSERDLSVGGAASVTAALFTGTDYAALGHIHRPQASGSVARYSGSPLAFSFSEAQDTKSVVVVDLAGERARHELVPCPVGRPLAVLRGTLDELLEDPAHAAFERAWVQATLTDSARPADAMERLRRRFPHAAELLFDPQGAAGAASGSFTRRLRGLDDAALMAGFVEDVRGTPATPEEAELLADALSARRAAEVSA